MATLDMQSKTLQSCRVLSQSAKAYKEISRRTQLYYMFLNLRVTPFNSTLHENYAISFEACQNNLLQPACSPMNIRYFISSYVENCLCFNPAMHGLIVSDQG